MKLVHVFKDYWPPLAAGITRYIADIADESARRGWTVEAHVAGVHVSRRDVLPSGVVVHRHRELGRLLSSPLAPGLVREIRRLDADIVHLHMPNPLGELGAVLSDGGHPVVISFHAQLGRQAFLKPIYGPLQRRVLDRASVIVVASERLAGAPELQSHVEKICILPYGVSPRFAAVIPPTATRSAVLRVLFVGRLIYYKGVEVLLQALAQLEGVTLTLVGDGPLRQDLERKASALGLASSVRFMGVVSDDALLDIYSSHDVFVLPSVSRAEAFGLAMAEAMASGLPAVSTSLGTATDWVNEDGESGFVVPPGDANALASALQLLHSIEVRHRLGAGARSRIERLFSFDRHCDALLNVYSQVLK
ncbi:MAG: glycosyltransferase [Actinomycetota bacterium]|nr:glycosyltransferase [Actinomycetota bacterium]